MSALAKLMLMWGKRVSCSDLSYNDRMVELNEWGAKVWVGHQPASIDAELIVYSLAVPHDDPELEYGRNNGIATVPRQGFLAELCREFDTVVAVAGTHGKTTTTAMIAAVFRQADLAFSAHIGGDVPGVGNAVFRGRRYFVTEACEYGRSFLALRPDCAVVTNLEWDHPDTYPDAADLEAAFGQFVSNVGKGGFAVVNGESFSRMKMCRNVDVTTFGDERTFDYAFGQVRGLQDGCFGFKIFKNARPAATVELSVPGYHNVFNATTAYAVCDRLGIASDLIVAALEGFSGVGRRFEYKGTVKGCRVYVDYAHHPTEIRMAIATAKQLARREVIVVFQPHTYSRTASLMTEFCEELSRADRLLIAKEYAARETPDAGKSAEDLYRALRDTMGNRVRYCDDTLTIAREALRAAGEGCVLLVLGAGDVDLVASLLV